MNIKMILYACAFIFFGFLCALLLPRIWEAFHAPVLLVVNNSMHPIKVLTHTAEQYEKEKPTAQTSKFMLGIGEFYKESVIGAGERKEFSPKLTRIEVVES